MSLLKTVLLSTTLMMSTTFGSESLGIAEMSHGADRSDAQVFADTLAEIRAENAEYLNMIKILVFKVHTGDVVSTDCGEFVDYIKALAKGLNATLRGKTQLESDLKTAIGQLTTATAANEELTTEKAKVEAILVDATAKLDTITKEKGDIDKKLAAAIVNVAEFSEKLEAARTAAEIAKGKAGEEIARLTSELNAAQEEVATLTEQADELGVIKANAEDAKRQNEAALRALAGFDTNTRAVILEGNHEGFLDPLEDAERLPTGVEAEISGSPESGISGFSPSESDDSPLKSIREASQAGRDLALEFAASEVDEAAKVEIATLQSELTKAQTATTASPFSGKGSKKKNEDAQAAAIRRVRDLIAQLKVLGVSVEATVAAK